MKKIEILKMIKANLRIMKTYRFLPWDKRQLPNWWFSDLTHARIVPRIEGLTTELNQLRKATKEIARETKEAKDFIKSIDCKHEIRLSKHHHFGTANKCIFCGEEINDNTSTYYINYEHKYQDEDEEEYTTDGFTEEDLYKIIIGILKDKKDDDEIDLVAELGKLNLGHTNNNQRNILKLK